MTEQSEQLLTPRLLLGQVVRCNDLLSGFDEIEKAREPRISLNVGTVLLYSTFYPRSIHQGVLCVFQQG